MVLTTGGAISALFVLAFGPYFKFWRVLALVVIKDATGVCSSTHYHSGAGDDCFVIIDVASCRRHLFHLFLVDTGPFVTLEI